MPEMVVYPRVTNDIRKAARFAWQLAEKGHVLPITARGGGTDETGGAIGKGVIVSSQGAHERYLEFDPKQKLIRVQPGVECKRLNDALIASWRGCAGVLSAIASMLPLVVQWQITAQWRVFGAMGDAREWTHQLEVVLANGDILQTGVLVSVSLTSAKACRHLRVKFTEAR